jgi:hypothetical protein
VGAKPITLKAKASSGLPVEFCVIDGPVEIREGKLVQTLIPPRSKFPLFVTIAASQWGRGVDPKIKAAKTVFQTFRIIPLSEPSKSE